MERKERINSNQKDKIAAYTVCDNSFLGNFHLFNILFWVLILIHYGFQAKDQPHSSTDFKSNIFRCSSRVAQNLNSVSAYHIQYSPFSPFPAPSASLLSATDGTPATHPHYR